MEQNLKRGTTVAPTNQDAILNWAAQRQTPIVLSVMADERWSALKSHFVRYDPVQHLIQIAYPMSGSDGIPELVAGQEIGLSFRRGHKKCLFTTKIVLRRTEQQPGGEPMETVLLKSPAAMQELQRRAYQRVICPEQRFVAVRLWEGPTAGEPGSWPLCSGRLGNISVGGVQIDIRADNNPRLAIGDLVGVEITVAAGKPTLMVDAQYRHCAMTTPGRLGLGFQFMGMEHAKPGRATLEQMAAFVKDLQREVVRLERRGEIPPTQDPYAGDELN